MPFDADSGPALQQQLDKDPQYQSLKQRFLSGGKQPLDWQALNAYVQRALNAGGNNSRTGQLSVDGEGNIDVQNNNNRWTSPATWGPIAVGAAGGIAALAANSGSAGGAAAGSAIPTGSEASGAALGGIPTTYGLTGAELGGSAATGAVPTAADVGGLVAGGGLEGGSTPSYLKALERGGQTATDLAQGRAQGRATEAGLTNNANAGLVNLYRAQIDSNNAQNQYGLNAANSENNFNTNAYGLDLNTANAANSFGLNKVNAGIGIGNLDLAQKNYALAAPGKRAGNSVRGDILANAQDASFNLPSTIPKSSISGGLRPSMFSANTRALGGELSSQALADQRKGDTFAPLPTLPNYQGPTSKLPTYKAPAPYVNPPPAPQLTAQPQANGLDTGLNIAGYASLAAPYLKYLKYL